MIDVKFFDNLRLKLLEDVHFAKEQVQSPQFTQDFFKLIELAVFSLLHKNENFFGSCIIQMHRKIDFNLPCAVGISAGLSCFNIFFNPLILLQCSLAEIKAEIKHQIYHIIHLHLIRADNLKEKYSPIVINIAMDIAINQFIDDLPEWEWTITKTQNEFGVDLKNNQTLETYCKIIHDSLEKNSGISSHQLSWSRPEGNENKDTADSPGSQEMYKDEHDQSHCHDVWKSSAADMNSQNMETLIKRLVKNADKGNLPEGFEEIVNKLTSQPEISWQEVIRKTIGSLPIPYKKTITRKNRRQPDRLDLRGTLPDRIIRIIIAVDTSGSMELDELEKAIAEIFALLKDYRHEVTIIECDCKIQKVYYARSPEDIKCSFKGRGGTAFTPVFDYINKNRLHNSLLIYFTDGQGEKELQVKPVNFRALWILTSNNELSLNYPYGIVKKLNSSDFRKEVV